MIWMQNMGRIMDLDNFLGELLSYLSTIGKREENCIGKYPQQKMHEKCEVCKFHHPISGGGAKKKEKKLFSP